MGKFAAKISTKKKLLWNELIGNRQQLYIFIYSDCPSKQQQQPHMLFVQQPIVACIHASAVCGPRFPNATCNRRSLICSPKEQMIHFKPQTTEPFWT